MTQASANFAVASKRSIDAPLPLAVCWMIWLSASAGLWFLALRLAAFLI